MDYKACWEYQQRLFDTLLRAKGTPAEGAGYLLLVEHPAVYTLGKSGHAENLLVGAVLALGTTSPTEEIPPSVP